MIDNIVTYIVQVTKSRIKSMLLLSQFGDFGKTRANELEPSK